ncbi:hypothetical protein [Desertivirga xinjiangensis]|uniref:hypothetical protein n=1 Tax=Desertivirga xinjiangensis TaxID=539206 RepID=UPI00210CB674|nr:hypothetical protein [Pedobacter xinjiangensis]
METNKNLQIYKRPEIVIPESITGEEKKLIAAFTDVRVSESSAKNAKNILEDSFLVAFDIGGYKLPEGETRDGLDRSVLHIQILSAQCYAELIDRHRNLTLTELKIIITNGARGDYGENHGITAASFSRWIKGYLASKEVEDAKEHYGLLLKKAHEQQYVKREPTAEEYSKRFFVRLNQLFSAHKAKGQINENEGAFYFFELYRERYISLTDEIRLQLKQKAFDILRAKSSPVTAISKWENEIFRIKTEELMSLGVDHPSVTNYAKYLGLLHWFDNLIEMEMEIEDALARDF